MGQIEDLPADQAAALRLLAGGMSTGDIASALGTDVAGVSELALSGIERLGADAARALTEAERKEVGEWLIGTREESELAEHSPAAQRYINEVSEQVPGLRSIEVAAVAPAALDPATEHQNRPPRRSRVASSRKASAEPPKKSTKPAPEPSDAPEKAAPKPSPQPKQHLDAGGTDDRYGSPVSRRGGIALIGGSVAVVVGLVLWATGTFESSGTSSKSASTQQSQTTGQAAATAKFVPRSKTTFPLRARAKGRVEGLVAFGTKAGQPALLVAATGLSRSSYVGIWLASKSSASFLGSVKPDNQGNFRVDTLVPSGAARSTALIITRENYSPGGAVPSNPGPILLSTDFGA